MKSTLTQDRIWIKFLAESVGITPEQVKGKSRSDKIYFGKQTIFWMLRFKANWTFQRIGEASGKDHSTILKNVKSFEGLINIEKRSEREFLNRVKILLPFFVQEAEAA